MPDLTVAGAGMAGLCAAGRARELGAHVRLHEKRDRAGGSMLLSSGVVWRYRDFDRFRAECPSGDAVLQRLVFDGVDERDRWLETLGARVIERDDRQPAHAGVRFEPGSLMAARPRGRRDRARRAAARAAREQAGVLATGGFQADTELLAEHANPRGRAPAPARRAGEHRRRAALRAGRGRAPSEGMDELYGRNMPAPPAPVEPGRLRPPGPALCSPCDRDERARGAP